MRLRIVVDENIPLADEFFSSLGEVVRLPGRTLKASDVADADALVVRSVTRVNRQLLEGSRVKFVGTCTIGTDHLDLEYLAENTVGFSSAPGCNANSVVEYVFSALSALAVDWRGKSVGIVGCGNVGGHLYRRLRELEVNCRCYDPFLTDQQNPDLVSLEQALESDIVCLHTPLTTTGEHPSHHLLGMEQLQQLKPGAVLLNAGRGPVLDNAALLQFLSMSNDVRVVLDVWEPEPELNTELMAKVDIATPHIAGYSFDGKVAGTEMIYKALCQHFSLPAPLTADQFLVTSGSHGCASGEKAFELLRQAVLAAYDVREDDKRMRAKLSGLEGRALAKAFDWLRKNYPERREFRHCELTLNSQIEKKPLNKLLATLGFSKLKT